MVKGIGYALEALVATITILIFSLGALQLASPSQDWSEYQRGVAAQDLSYSMQSSGHLESFIQRGETGSVQTAIATISDRDMEVTGLVSNIPVYETSVGFYTKQDHRLSQDVTDDLGSCEGELRELEDASSDPILRTDNGFEEDSGVALYFGNTNATDAEVTSGYDTLWVDNSTECQFAGEDGPFYLDEVFYWGDDDTEEVSDFFDFKEIDADENGGDALFYNATQPVRIMEQFERGINQIRTDTSFDMVDFDQVDSEDYDLVVFRESVVLDDINDDASNRQVLEEHLLENSALFLMNLDESDMDGFVQDAGFEWFPADYEDGYDGEPTNIDFSDASESVHIETFFKGLDGEASDTAMNPPGKLISDEESTLEPSRDTVYGPAESHDTSDLDVVVSDMQQSNDFDQAPDSECYEIDHNLDNDDALTEQSNVEFPEHGEVDVLNARLGSDSDTCNLDERGVKLDTDQSGEYDSDLILNGEEIELGDRRYIMNAQNVEGCDNNGECVEFLSPAESFIELAPYRDSFDEFTGEKIMFAGYQERYGENELKLLSAMMYWLRGNEYSFEGEEDPEGVSTTVHGSVEEEVYLPYTLNLRWSE